MMASGCADYLHCAAGVCLPDTEGVNANVMCLRVISRFSPGVTAYIHTLWGELYTGFNFTYYSIMSIAIHCRLY